MSNEPTQDAEPEEGEERGAGVMVADGGDLPTAVAVPESARGRRAPSKAEGDTSGGASSASGTMTPGTLGATPAETMHLQEVARTRRFCWVSLGFVGATAATIPFSGGDPVAWRLLVVGLVPCSITFVWFGLLLRDPAQYSVPRVTVTAIAAIVGAFAGIYYFGIFSPAVVLIPVGLYFFSLSRSPGATTLVYLACALGYLTLSLGMHTGALEDRGIVSGQELTATNRLVMLTLTEATFFFCLLVARATRSTTLAALEQHDRAVRGIAKREALLEEARHDLERALEAGKVGRFTDQTMGSFRLGTVLGRGGMGEVYEAIHVETSQLAAVKMLHAHVLSDPDMVRRFMREARIAASLDVQHVVRVLEIGGLEAGTLPYIAMELLRGTTLADQLRKSHRLSMRSVVELVRQVGVGLDAARQAGVVHRDVKPRNLFLAEVEGKEPIWKVLDFGVSKLVDFEATVNKAKIIGTPAYMAPEQANRGTVGHRTDLFALAVVCYRALTGRPAFSGDGMIEIVYQVIHCMPPRPSEAARLHPDVDLALAIGLAKDPADRYDSATELADALESAARGRLEAPERLRAQRILARHPWGHDQMTPLAVALPPPQQ